MDLDTATQKLIEEYLPVAFVFDPRALRRVRRAFPFDSGAFARGAYGSVHHKSFTLEDFALETSLKAAGQVVKAFFGDNDAYLQGKPLDQRPHNVDQPEARAHFALIEGAADLTIDDRRYTVELQTRASVDLDGLLAVVMPHDWLDADSTKDFFKSHPKVDPLTYSLPSTRRLLPWQGLRLLMRGPPLVEVEGFVEPGVDARQFHGRPTLKCLSFP